MDGTLNALLVALPAGSALLTLILGILKVLEFRSEYKNKKHMQEMMDHLVEVTDYFRETDDMATKLSNRDIGSYLSLRSIEGKKLLRQFKIARQEAARHIGISGAEMVDIVEELSNHQGYIESFLKDIPPDS